MRKDIMVKVHYNQHDYDPNTDPLMIDEDFDDYDDESCDGDGNTREIE